MLTANQRAFLIGVADNQTVLPPLRIAIRAALAEIDALRKQLHDCRNAATADGLKLYMVTAELRKIAWSPPDSPFGRCPSCRGHRAEGHRVECTLVAALGVLPIAVCEHGVREGVYCETCNAEYKRAAREHDAEEELRIGGDQ